MKLHYYPETDSLYMDFQASPSVESKEIAEGWVADYDQHGSVVGLDIQSASAQMDLSMIETVNLPIPIRSLSSVTRVGDSVVLAVSGVEKITWF